MKNAMRWRRAAMLAMGLFVFIAGQPASFAQASATRPVVYVADFELDAADVKADDNRVDRARGILKRLRPLGDSQADDPQAHAQRIVASMSSELMSDLQHAGFDVRRLNPGDATPPSGWLVRGVFLSVDEGNRVKRAVVGFGAGQNTIEVAVAIDYLAAQTPAPLYQTIEAQSSEHKPGAAVTLNPYVAAAKFVLSKGDEHTTIVNTAKKIADEVVRHANAAPSANGVGAASGARGNE